MGVLIRRGRGTGDGRAEDRPHEDRAGQQRLQAQEGGLRAHHPAATSVLGSWPPPLRETLLECVIDSAYGALLQHPRQTNTVGGKNNAEEERDCSKESGSS